MIINDDATERMRITSAGNVGIGTTSPSAKFHIHSTSGDGLVRITGDNIINSGGAIKGFNNGLAFNVAASGGGSEIEAIRIQGNGNVGIGTASPSAKLNVNGVITANDSIQVQNDDSGFICRDAAGTVIGTIGAQSSSSTNIGMFTVRDNGNNRIVLNANGSSYFNGGSVGIGTTSPDALLELEKSASGAVGPKLLLNNAAGGLGDSGDIIFASFGNTYQRAKIEFKVSGETNNPGNINFYTGRSDLGTLTQKMTILGGGYVGIGETNPQELLHLTATTPVFRLEGGSHSYQQYVDGTSFYIRDVTNSSNRVVLDSSGNIGIGTTSPGYKLEVNGNAEFLNNINIKNNAYDDYQIAVDSVGFSVYNRTDAIYNMTISHTGNVGIGTTSPSGGAIGGKVVHLVNSGGTASFRVDRSDSSTTGTISLIDTNSTIGLYGTGQKPMAFSTNSTERMRLTSNGDLHVDADIIGFSTTISDQRLKEKIITIDGALDKVKNLRGVSYYWNSGNKKGKKDLGVIAQEVEKVLPEIVVEKKMEYFGDKNYKTVDYEKLTAVLIESVKELSAKVEALENKCCNCK